MWLAGKATFAMFASASEASIEEVAYVAFTSVPKSQSSVLTPSGAKTTERNGDRYHAAASKLLLKLFIGPHVTGLRILKAERHILVIAPSYDFYG